MATASRVVAVSLVFLLIHGSARAQLPVAPPPHDPVEELAKEYMRWQLPVPSADAQLVRLKWYPDQKKPYLLAFRHAPGKPGEPTRFLVGASWCQGLKVEATVVTKTVGTKLAPADLEELNQDGTDWLTLAAHFRLRGWEDLATVAYRKAVAQLDETDVQPGQTPWTLKRRLHGMAWAHWRDKIMERNSDRKEIFSRLEALAKAEPQMLTEADQYLLADLKLTAAPSRSKPGSIEALIDDLTDHWDDPDDLENEAGQVAYWKLIEHGFDAIPALMEHLEDWRLTRTKTRHWKTQQEHIVRVAELCEYMLNKLAAEKFLVPMSAAEWKPPKEQKWWADARKLGEEKWLMQYVIPEDAEMDEQRPNGIILRVIRAKYPQRLKDVYQTVLLKRPKINSEPIIKAIIGSKLPLKEKISLLEDGIERGDSGHRHSALEWLAEVDPVAFRKQFMRVLENAPANLEERADGHNWKPGSVGLIRKTNDPKCWDALRKACQRVSPETRLQFIRVAGWPLYTGEPDAGRRESLRFLLRFLDAETLKDFGRDDAREIRDLATFQLAKQFAIIDWELDPQSNKPLQSPRELSLLRVRVRELAERELAQPMK